MYLVVKFHSAGGTMEVVPQTWFNRLTSSCWWPDVENPDEIYKLVTSSAPIGDTWSLYEAESLGTFSKYIAIFYLSSLSLQSCMIRNSSIMQKSNSNNSFT